MIRKNALKKVLNFAKPLKCVKIMSQEKKDRERERERDDQLDLSESQV